jgi:hypothetical protein
MNAPPSDASTAPIADHAPADNQTDDHGGGRDYDGAPAEDPHHIPTAVVGVTSLMPMTTGSN